ncbi:MAG: 3-deoxy-manno-octulosonate cytidylyltransferase [Planctomycetes bacterium]|nr:3-deoxy-manno-octulosonate cytidylyltransferase [Planctomycetota bacterium]
MRTVAIVPARYGSTRLPGKPLLRRTGKYLIQHVVERLASVRGLDRVLVATDDARIQDAVRSFGGESVMTSPEHLSGSDRVAEAARSIEADVVLNVQGDEPEIAASSLQALLGVMEKPGVVMGTLACPIPDRREFADPSKVKVVCDLHGDALYFSRASIPHGALEAASTGQTPAGRPLRHVGLYGFRRDFLFTFAGLPPTPLERLERLEQLRALEHGHRIRVGWVDGHPPGIDTPEDYEGFVGRVGGGGVRG